MKKLLIIPFIALLLCGCEVNIGDNAQRRAVKKCREDGGHPIVQYCIDSEYICKVICDLGDSNE